MNRYLISLLLFISTSMLQAQSSDAYIKRFLQYQDWHQNLPQNPTEPFLIFIQEHTPLATKLREQWLYQLAQKKDWEQYKKYYVHSEDKNLSCFNLLADYYLGEQTKALKEAERLWLSPDSEPAVCNQLFNLMLQQDTFDEALITQRIRLSLEKGNIMLARVLLKRYKKPHIKEEQALMRLYQNPRRLDEIPSTELEADLTLYALKRLVSKDMPYAIQIANRYKTKHLLSLAQKQAFIAQVALYKAMRNQPDHVQWFSQLKPEFYTDILIDWEIRAAIKSNNWLQTQALINQSKDKDSPCWRYWLARAKEALGNHEEADALYTQLATERNYYGFLTSLRTKKPFHFQDENPNLDLSRLKRYQVVLDKAKSLYLGKEIIPASRLLNDFMSELPPEDKSSLVYWLESELQWTGKSLFLSHDKAMLNQLMLRFPLTHKQKIALHAKTYQISMPLIFSIIRQESEFREQIESEAGARGLMQLMPETASMVARLEHIAYTNKEELFSSQKNIHLGIAYLKYLAKRFHNHYLLMIAAYNAGPRQVHYWLQNQPAKEIDIWVETIPWHETRNYIKNVIAFYAVYQYRLHLKPNLDNFMQPFDTI